jgi:hypothetical protein
MLRAAAKELVPIPQRSDENRENEVYDSWVIRDDGKLLYTIDTEGVTLGKLKKCNK